MAEEDDVLARIRRGETVHHFETVRRRKDGSEIAVSLTVSPIHDASGAIIGASKIARNISEQKRAGQRAGFLVDIGAVVIGDPEECIRLAQGYRDAGTDLLLCNVNPYDIPRDQVTRSIELLGEHVLPALR